MSIRKLFDSNKPQTVLVSTNLEEEVVKNAPELESADNVREQIKRINRYIPAVDFADPANFVTYGSAQSYYEDAVSRIYREFPYDGSEEEITRFHNESNYLDLYIFDNRYPRTTGYAIFSSDGWSGATPSLVSGWGSSSAPEYISFVGGPHTASGGMPAGTLHYTFTGSNYYDTDIYGTDGTLALDRVGSRESNLNYDLSKGVSVEFWLNKDTWLTASTEKEVIFDLWNGSVSSSAGYGRFLLYVTGATDGADPLYLHLGSGSNTADISLLSSAYTTASIADGAWHHYAVTVQSGSTGLTTKAYVDGTLNKTTTSAIDFGAVTGSLKAFIGALQTAPSGAAFASTTMTGYGKLSGSIDEFRYWKSKRDEKDIQNNWWTQVRGGTNEEIANAELGVYYKFNEGITSVTATDSVVLDYSGRITNGTWVGYPGSSARSTGSAIDSSAAVVADTVEYKDPIIYSTHPDVSALYDELSSSGSVHDYENQASIKDSIPSWIIDQDETQGSNEVTRLTQIVGSYFDTLNLQIKALPHLTDNTYLTSSAKPTPFARNLLSSKGLEVPEIFVDADILERFANRRSDRAYELDLNEVKNLIYQNIYNNLTYIYKSKGTEKAFRNLIRCYGIGDEVVQFNAYGNNAEFKFEDTDYSTITRKNFVDFNHPDRFGGIVYQSSSATNSETTGITHVTGTNRYLPNTAEVEVFFPRKYEFSNPQYFHTPFLSSSIFGHHNSQGETNFDWLATAADDKNFQLYFVRTHLNSRDGYFQLRNRAGTLNLTSSVYSNVYDNQKWNFAVRIKHEKYPYSNGLTGSTSNAHILEWYGVNTEFGVVKNEFEVTASGLGNDYLTNDRRYYIGADRTNYSGSVVTNSDVKVTSIRHWASYLENEVIVEHAKDPANVGTKFPSRNIAFNADSTSSGVDNQTIPNIESLAMHWDFAQVTGTDAGGAFTVEDASSGSVSLASRYSNDGNLSTIIGSQYAGVAYFPAALSSTSVIDKEFLPTNRQRLPEVVNSADAVNVLSRDDELYPRDAAVSQMFFAFEKSMYGIVSQEMVNYFGTIVEFNNLIGDVVNKYRGDYKGLRLLRQLFFEKIQNNPDLDKFIEYYKWIDNSLGIFLQQLVPASADVSDEIRTVVEDHILSRSKYDHKYPHLDYKGNERFGGDDAKLEARVKGIEELTYNWEFGHAPLNNLQSTSGRWWKDRAKRDNTAFGTADPIDTARQDLNDIILSFNSASAEEFNESTGIGNTYFGSTYALRNFAQTTRTTVHLDKKIGGGYNYPPGHRPDALFSITRRGTGNANKLTFSNGDFKDLDLAETGEPIVTIKRRYEEVVGTHDQDQNGYSTNKNNPLAVVYSSSAGATGYRSDTAGVEFAGFHNDSYGPEYDVPMQGPFTDAHVGGYRHRHEDLTGDPTLTSSTTRAEAWFRNGTNYSSADYNFTRPSASPQYRRGEGIKRPVNVENIQHRTGSNTIRMGNFDKRYEVVMTNSRRTNNSQFVKNEGFSTASVTSDVLGYVEALVDYAKPVRARTEHVIVNRFSAPGGPETAGDSQGGAGLDYVSSELSPYNNLNYRNLTVRQPLRTLLTERSEQFGLRSGSAVSALDYTSVTASFHKINRNGIKQLESSSAGGIVTSSVFDNYYVQHMNPQSDLQYTWITASYVSTVGDIYGYLPYDGLASSSAGLVSAINFVSASELVTAIGTGGGGRRVFLDRTQPGAAPTDFAGINTTIIEPISASDFTIGYPPTVDVRNYYNYSDIGSFAENTFYSSSYINTISVNASVKTYELLYSLNHILSHRGSVYGYNTWKQQRVGEGRLPRYFRENNIYTHTPKVGEPITVTVPGGTTTVPVRNRATLAVTQSSVDVAFRPLSYKLVVKTGENDKGEDINSIAVVKASFGNNLAFFEDSDFNEAIGAQIDFRDTPYRTLLNLYGRKNKQNSSLPIKRLSELRYSEVVYPSRANIYRDIIRGRTSFENNFWRDARADRATKGEAKKSTNVAQITVSQSAWALDAAVNFTTYYPGIVDNLGGIGQNNSASTRPGQLQNLYVHYHAGTASNARPGLIYARKQIYPLTGAVMPIWGMQNPEIATPISDTNILAGQSLFRGEALWEAATQAGAYEGTSSTFVSSAANPFYDDYEAYFADIRSKGKDYSIVPEFRISEHIDFYDANSDDFLKENQKLFSIFGTPTASTVPQNSSEANFFKVFTNSDFMKHFELIKNDHERIADPHAITLKCKAIKKFVPYDGFYPAERTTEMVEQFIQDYSGSVNKISGQELGEGASLRTFLKPLFAPGILYNTIKSGIAVDYPILEEGMTVTAGSNTPKRGITYEETQFPVPVQFNEFITSASYAILSSNRTESRNAVSRVVDHSQGWDDRIPFEAIIDPDNYLASKRIADDEPSNWARVRSVVSFDGTGGTKYKKMINNFFAESVNFFLPRGQLTKLESLPETEFKTVTPGTPYGMRVKMWRSMDQSRLFSGSWGNFEVPQNTPEFGSTETRAARETFTMYSRPGAFGVPLALYVSGNHNLWPGADTIPGTNYDFTPANGIYGSHTPPYYDGECWFDIIFFPRGLETQFSSSTPQIFQFKADETGEQYRPTLDEIFASPHPAIFANSGSENNNTPLAGSFTRKWRYDQEALKNIAGSSYHVKSFTGGVATVPYVGPASGPFMNEWAMQLDSCLNIFRKNRAGRRWSIQTKFETPMLNFNHVSTGSNTLTVTDDADANSCIPRGMWHQFGRLPLDGEGVYLQITDIPSQWLNTHPSATLVPDPAGTISSLNKSRYVNNESDVATYYNGYSVPIGSGSGYVQPEVQSLVDICGFSTDPVRIGEVRNRKFLREAVIAVPFKIVDGERKFYRTFDPRQPESRISGESYRNLVNAMQRYVFPPTFDFVNNPEVTPVSMYVFEFKHELTKDDLSKIWQNVTPNIGTEAQASFATISHELLANELLGDIEEANAARPANMPYDDMDNQIQWMVFKVKQRARGDYFEDVEYKDRSMPFYTYNWPYDFCSLVELAQLEVSMDFKKIPDTRKVRAKRVDLPDELALADRGAGGTFVGDLNVFAETSFRPGFERIPGSVDTSRQGGDVVEESGPIILGPGGFVDAETAASQTAREIAGNLEGGRTAVAGALNNTVGGQERAAPGMNELGSIETQDADG